MGTDENLSETQSTVSSGLRCQADIHPEVLMLDGDLTQGNRGISVKENGFRQNNREAD